MEQDPSTERYKLGYTFLEMSSKLLGSIDLREVAKPFLKMLEEETNEVIHLVVHDHGEVVYIEKLDGNEALRMHSSVGKRAPMHCTSVGKVILAHLPSEAVTNIIRLKGLPPHTEHTITDESSLLKELIQVKKQGYAFDLEENENGIVCIAAPIFDHTGKIAAAISISGPEIRLAPEKRNTVKESVMTAAKQISTRLGY